MEKEHGNIHVLLVVSEVFRKMLIKVIGLVETPVGLVDTTLGHG